MTDAAGESSVAIGTDSSEGAPVPEAETPASRKLKLKVNGEEIEVDEAEVTRDYQKYRGADQKFQEAAALRKQAAEEKALVDNFLDRAQKGDLGWLKGLVPQEQLTKFAESELLQHIEWEQLPEAEKRARQAELKAQELEKKISEFTQTREREEASSLEERAYQQIDTEIVEAVKNLGYDYKVTPRLIRRIAEQLYASLEEPSDPDAPPQAPLTAKEASDRAFKGLLVDAQEILATLPVDEAIALLPPSLRKAIRKADVEAATGPVPSTPRPRQVDLTREKDRPAPGKLKRMSTDEYFKLMEQKLKSRK